MREAQLYNGAVGCQTVSRIATNLRIAADRKKLRYLLRDRLQIY